MGGSVWFRRFRADAAVLNIAPLSEPEGDSLPGRQPREFSFGLGYGIAGDWVVTGRLGIQDSSRRQSIIDVGFEKRFFQAITFRVGNQRRYASEEGMAAREIRSSLAGGIWYRMNGLGKGCRYPDRDGELLGTGTVMRLLHNLQMGGTVMLTRVPGEEGHPGEDDTSSSRAVLIRHFALFIFHFSFSLHPAYSSTRNRFRSVFPPCSRMNQ